MLNKLVFVAKAVDCWNGSLINFMTFFRFYLKQLNSKVLFSKTELDVAFFQGQIVVSPI